MGYSYWLTTAEKNTCQHCGRSDPAMQLEDSGMTWNHNYAFFEIFGKEGFRNTVYHRPLTDVIPDIELVLEWMENNGNEGDWNTDYRLNCYSPNKPEEVTVMDMKGDPYQTKFDGWGATNGNAYYYINELLELCKKHVDEHPDAEWSGD